MTRNTEGRKHKTQRTKTWGKNHQSNRKPINTNAYSYKGDQAKKRKTPYVSGIHSPIASHRTIRISSYIQNIPWSRFGCHGFSLSGLLLSFGLSW